ncbi:MAG: hypothetical protein AB1798_08145 [Spirochaetota bacterium]
MYIAIAILAAIFAVGAPGRSEKSSVVPAPAGQQVEGLVPNESPVLIDGRFSRKAAPWEKGVDPAEFLPSARTC